MSTYIIISEMSYLFTTTGDNSIKTTYCKLGSELSQGEKQNLIDAHYQELREYFNFIIELN